MSEDISWRELACRRKEDMDGLNLQIDALHARMEASTDYSIKLQQLIENLKYPESEVPFPELHHHKMIVAAKARIRELESALTSVLAQPDNPTIWFGVVRACFKSETECNHDLQSSKKTLKAIMDGSLNGFYCTVCNERWGFPVETKGEQT